MSGKLKLWMLSGLLLLNSTVLYANEITVFTLINADTDSEIEALSSGAMVNLATLPTRNLNIRANTGSSPVDSVALSLSGATTANRTEGVAPYALWGDSGGDYNAGTFNTGAHTLSAEPTHNGVAGTPLTINFTVSDNAVGQPTANAGGDHYLVLPDDSAVLHGSGSDDSSIAAYEWTQLNGPNTAVFSGADTATLTVSGLVAGTYTMRLTVRDNDNNTATDDAFLFVSPPGGDATVSGQLKKWHKVTLTFDGPATGETASPNPFTHYRLNVTFTNGATTYVVPGYFAADGNAANTGAASGNKWRVHFAPDKTGTWSYGVSFRSGADIAADDDPAAGTAISPLDGLNGTFEISDTDKTDRDHRGKGRLQYIGEHFLKFAETGEYFLKQGADAPENFLAYDDFDNTPNNGGRRKSWSAHVPDWNGTDPTWMGDKGKGIIGAINYLASEGMNAFSFIPMNIGGDDRNVFPYISGSASHRTRLDCSKLDQWEIVFAHADKMGMFLHFKTQETENELLLDNGNLGTERKLYYRELIARFGHHLALNWNLGEEINDASTSQKQAWAQYFHDTDPYDHHIVIHNMGDPHYDLLGSASLLTGFSLQTGNSNFSAVHSRVKDYLSRSAAAGRPWAVACDEPGDASHALRPDNDAGNSHEDGRKNALWGTFLAGGWGNEWYFGYQHDHSDLTCQDFRSRDSWWDYCRFALEFFMNNDIPFWQMTNDNSLSSAGNDYCFFQDGQVYVVYLKNGGSTNLDLRSIGGDFEVKWYDPRSGGSLQDGSLATVSGGSWADLGNPPSATSSDWVVLVRGAGDSNTLPTADAGPDQTVTDTDSDGSHSVTLDGSASSDPDGAISNYVWTEAGVQVAMGSNPTLSLDVGAHTLTLTVSDNEGATDSDLVVITVNAGGASNHSPVVETSPWAESTPVELPDTATLHVTASDPDGDALTYTWSVQSGPGNVQFDPNGTIRSDVTQATFDAAGDYVLAVSVSDGDLAVSQELMISVTATDNGNPTDTGNSEGGSGGGCFIQHLVF